MDHPSLAPQTLVSVLVDNIIKEIWVKVKCNFSVSLLSLPKWFWKDEI